MISTENVTLQFSRKKHTMRGGIQLQVCPYCDFKKFCNPSCVDGCTGWYLNAQILLAQLI